MWCPCVGFEENVNLTNAQKKLLLWHWKLGITMHSIQELMHVCIASMPTVTKPKFASTSNNPVPKYTYCELTHA